MPDGLRFLRSIITTLRPVEAEKVRIEMRMNMRIHGGPVEKK
jgi:hypothetical protein